MKVGSLVFVAPYWGCLGFDFNGVKWPPGSYRVYGDGSVYTDLLPRDRKDWPVDARGRRVASDVGELIGLTVSGWNLDPEAVRIHRKHGSLYGSARLGGS